jgi:5-methylcytosine-specific restriction endonuclease McrA
VELEVHHVIWQSEGGGDSPENLLTLCAKCHEKVHRKPKIDAKVKELFVGIKKRYVHTTLVNTIMQSFAKWLVEEFAEMYFTYGYETKEKRRALDLPKDHVIDAYLISFADEEQVPAIQWDDLLVYRFMQLRRHHRQIIHATRDRNYKEGKHIVARNRRKRTGQLTESLAELVDEKGRQILSRLRILPGKKVKRSKFDTFRKGDVVCYKGECHVGSALHVREKL